MALYEQHSIGKMIPPMTEGEYDELKIDIETRGLRDPITLYQGKILDGWHRYRACIERAVVPRFDPFDGTEDQAAALVISRNLMRRHLTTAQRAGIAANLKNLKVRTAARSPGRPARGRDNNFLNNEKIVSPVNSTVEAAKELRVSIGSIADFERIVKAAPELEPDLRAGKMTLGKAKRMIKERKPKGEPMPNKPPPPPSAELKEADAQGRLANVSIDAKHCTPEAWAAFHQLAFASGKSLRQFLGELITATALKPPFQISATGQKALDAARRAQQAALDLQFNARVQAEKDRLAKAFWTPERQRQLDDSRKVLAARKGVFTVAEYRKILTALHPDKQPTATERTEAMALFNEHRLVLMSEKEDPRLQFVAPLPTSAAGLVGQRKVKARRGKVVAPVNPTRTLNAGDEAGAK